MCRWGRGRGGVQAALQLPLVVLTVCLHQLLTDGGKGRAGAKRLSPQAGRAGGGCFVARVCVGRGKQLVVRLLGPLRASAPGAARGCACGRCEQESGQGVGLPTAWGWLCCPCPCLARDSHPPSNLCFLLPAGPPHQGHLLPTPHWVLGVGRGSGTGIELWSRWTSIGRTWGQGGPWDHRGHRGLKQSLVGWSSALSGLLQCCPSWPSWQRVLAFPLGLDTFPGVGRPDLGLICPSSECGIDSHVLPCSLVPNPGPSRRSNECL